MRQRVRIILKWRKAILGMVLFHRFKNDAELEQTSEVAIFADGTNLFRIVPFPEPSPARKGQVAAGTGRGSPERPTTHQPVLQVENGFSAFEPVPTSH